MKYFYSLALKFTCSISLLLAPSLAFASDTVDNSVFLWLTLAGIVFWSIAIKLCRMGGGWILLGVLIGILVALPVTGYALMFGAVIWYEF